MTDAERALLTYVEVLTLTPAQSTDEDIQKLRVAGWSDPQIAEAVYIIAMFAFFNRVADAFGLPAPDLDFMLKKPSPE